jgi:hypothetical protein
MDPTELVSEDGQWIELTQDRIKMDFYIVGVQLLILVP